MWEVTTQGVNTNRISVGYFGGWLASYFYSKGKEKTTLYSEVHNKALELDLFLHL